MERRQEGTGEVGETEEAFAVESEADQGGGAPGIVHAAENDGGQEGADEAAGTQHFQLARDGVGGVAMTALGEDEAAGGEDHGIGAGEGVGLVGVAEGGIAVADKREGDGLVKVVQRELRVLLNTGLKRSDGGGQMAGVEFREAEAKMYDGGEGVEAQGIIGEAAGFFELAANGEEGGIK